MMRMVTDAREAIDIMPQVLYKYRSWDDERHKDLLRKGVVYFAAPDSFEDTFDCNLPEVFPEGKVLFRLFLKSPEFLIRILQNSNMLSSQNTGVNIHQLLMLMKGISYLVFSEKNSVIDMVC